jgi:hypothetical protein
MVEEFKLTEFIELPSQVGLFEKLDDAVARKKFCTLLGPLGCGKTWLLDYWRRARKGNPGAIKPKEALYIHLRPATESSLPMTCVVYSRLWYALQRLNRPKYLPDNECPGAKFFVKIDAQFFVSRFIASGRAGARL